MHIICLTLGILMDFPIQIHTIRMGLSIIYFKGSQKFPNNYCLQALMIVFTLANSEDTDEMPHFAAFHLGLHCLLPKDKSTPLGVSSIHRVKITFPVLKTV